MFYLLLILTLFLSLPHEGDAMHAYNVANEHIRFLHIPPRLQWNENSGYCGEVALISAGMYFGQYISQYDARAIACRAAEQSTCQLLLGKNAHYAAALMHLESEEWPPSQNPSPYEFLTWIKENIRNGYPVAVGVYMNQYRFYHNKNPLAGDPKYDHIVPITGIGSYLPFDQAEYDGRDILYFSDNGLWGDPANPAYRFSYPFNTFPATREQANAKHGQIYALPSGTHNYGIAIRGVLDPNEETLRVQLTTSPNEEHPDIANASSERPSPLPLTLNINIFGLEPGVAYNLYQYDSFASVPNRNFNEHAESAVAKWEIQIESGSTYEMQLEILSDQTAIFRAVRA